jgi:hypothetical protein
MYPVAQVSQNAGVYSLNGVPSDHSWHLVGDHKTVVGVGIRSLQVKAASLIWGATINGRSFSADQQVFDLLVHQWRRERGVTSSVTAMAMCPAYQRIIAMGHRAVPAILRQLESEGDDPDHWFWALRFLTNADPVPADARGDMKKMAAAWLTWGHLNGFAW